MSANNARAAHVESHQVELVAAVGANPVPPGLQCWVSTPVADGASHPDGPPSEQLPTAQSMAGTLRHVIVHVIIRGAMESLEWLTVWGSLVRGAPSCVSPQPAGDAQSNHRVFYPHVHHVGLSDSTKDVIVDLEPINVVFRGLFVALAKVGTPVIVPVQLTSTEASGAFEGYPNSTLLRGQISAMGYAQSPGFVVFGANIGHEIHEVGGPMSPMFLGHAQLALTSESLVAPGSLFRAVLECIRRQIGLGGIVVPDDINVGDLHVVAPMVLGRMLDGSPIFDRDVTQLAPVVAERSLERVMKHFVPGRHSWSVHAFASNVLQVLAVAVVLQQSQVLCEAVENDHVLAWVVRDWGSRHQGSVAVSTGGVVATIED